MSHSNVSLPTVRAHQLRILARDNERPAVDILDEFIQGAWEWAGYEADGYLPPFDISAGRDDETGHPRVFLVYPGAPILDLSILEAHRLADGIKEITKGTMAPSKVVVHASSGGDLGGVVAERKGRGLVLKFCDTHDGAARTFAIGLTKSVAQDLARAILVTADKAMLLISAS